MTAATLYARGFDSDRLHASVARLLGANTLCSMATRSEAGAVHINTAFFCFDDELQLYFLSHPDSVHCRNLARVPQMAVAVCDSHQAWGDPHSGLQLLGTGGLATDEADGKARRLYAARFPLYREFLRRALEEQPENSSFRRLRFYRFLPERVQILDEWEFGEEAFIPATLGR